MANKAKSRRGPQLELAGDLGVAFVNTASERDWNFQQGVRNYADLVTWGQQAGVIRGVDAERLSRLASERPADAEAAAARALKLRADLFRVFVLFATEKLPAPADLETLNAALAEALPALRVVPGDGSLTWDWGGDENAFDRVLWAAVRSAAELLVSLEGRLQVRQCARRGCTLFFVARDSRRKWCGVLCRNRTKALRYYHRTGKQRREEAMYRRGAWKVRRPRKRTFS